ncbi:MAG: hypothetical protein HZC51_12560 [Nitrospirae bacterium]|nr:hypothetical protein [Nitrospirota bacterium]
MVRRVISILLYIIAGYFVFMMTAMAFIAIPYKAVFLSVVFAIALIFLAAGGAVNRFRRWKTAFGAVLLSVGGFSAFGALTMASILLDDELLAMMPEPDTALSFDYITGFSILAMQICAGILLIKLENQPAADAPQGGATVEAEK